LLTFAIAYFYEILRNSQTRQRQVCVDTNSKYACKVPLKFRMNNLAADVTCMVL